MGFIRLKRRFYFLLITFIQILCASMSTMSMEPPPDKVKQATKLLVDAAFSGDAIKVQQALQQGADIDSKNGIMTPLHCAASRGHTEVVEALLARGAHINGKEHYQTPLFVAALNRQRRVVHLLLSHGASIGMPEGSSPAHRKLINAVVEGSIQKVAEACSGGADPNAHDHDACSALHWACIGGRADVVLFLLKQGANPRVADAEGNTPLHYAALGGYYCCAHYLLRKGAQADRKNKAGDTPLHYVASRGQERVAELLCKNGASVHARNGKGDTPLHEASLRGKIAVVMLLLAKEPEVNARNNNMMTPLHNAARLGHCKVAEALLNHGAKIDAQSGPDNHWYMALNYATMNGHYAMVKLLLERNASEKLAYQQTNLFFDALSSGNCDLIRYFFDRGVRIDQNYPFVESGIVHKHHLKAVRLLLSRGANIGRALAHVMYVHPTDVVPSEAEMHPFVSLVLEYGANVMDVLEGQTCTLLAAKYGYKRVLALLATYGAPVKEIENQVTYDSCGIFWATAFGDYEAVQKIVAECALPEAALKEAFIIAATQGHCQCLECLFLALEKIKGWEDCVYQALTFIQRIICYSSLTPEQKSHYNAIKNLLFSYSLDHSPESPEGRRQRALAFTGSILRRTFLRRQERDDYRITHTVLQAPLIRPERVIDHARQLISRITHLTHSQEERTNYCHLAALLGLPVSSD